MASRARFLQLVVYFLVVFSCGLFQNSFAPISKTYKQMFHDTDLEVSMFSMIIPICSIFFSFFTPGFYGKFGYRQGVVLGSVGLFLGGWIRFAGSLDTSSRGGTCWIIWCGQAIMSTGFPLLLAGAPLLSDSWFPADERAIATAFGGLAPIVGSVGASVLAPAFFTGGNTQTGDWNDHRKELRMFMLTEAGFASVCCVGVWLFAKGGKLEEATAAAHTHTKGKESKEAATDALIDETGESDADPEEAEQSPTEVVLILLKDKQFMLLMAVFGCGYGALNAITTLINAMLQPVGYSDDDIGLIGAALGLGVLGSFVFGYLADVTGKFVLILKICAIPTGLGFIWFVVQIYADTSSRSTFLLFTALGVTGAFGIPLVPIVLELAVETLYCSVQNPQAVAGSFLWLSGNLVGVIAVLVATGMEQCGKKADDVCENPPAMRNAAIFLTGLMCLSVLASLLFNGELKRKEAERLAVEAEEEHAEESTCAVHNDTC